jgi:hypothetical protein
MIRYQSEYARMSSLDRVGLLVSSNRMTDRT